MNIDRQIFVSKSEKKQAPTTVPLFMFSFCLLLEEIGVVSRTHRSIDAGLWARGWRGRGWRGRGGGGRVFVRRDFFRQAFLASFFRRQGNPNEISGRMPEFSSGFPARGT